jgi:hypothetical protein
MESVDAPKDSLCPSRACLAGMCAGRMEMLVRCSRTIARAPAGLPCWHLQTDGSVNTGLRTMTQPQQGPAGMCGKDGKCWYRCRDDGMPSKDFCRAGICRGWWGGEHGPEDNDLCPTRAAWLACANDGVLVHVKDDSLCPSKDCRAGICGELMGSGTEPEDDDLCPTRAAWLACAGRMESVGDVRTIACAPASKPAAL